MCKWIEKIDRLANTNKRTVDITRTARFRRAKCIPLSILSKVCADALTTNSESGIDVDLGEICIYVV